jgi:hypothetical protein
MLRVPATAVLIVVTLITFVVMAAERSGDWPPGFLVTWGGNLATLNTFMSLLASVDVVAHAAGFAVGIGAGPLLFRASFVQKAPERAEPTFSLGPVRRPSAPASFQEPMDFPQGTDIYRTRSRLVAILPGWTLIADGGAAGAMFDTASEYREKMGDEGEWTFVRKF